LFNKLFEVAKWDPLPFTDDICEFLFGYVDSPPISINFEGLGYETTLVTNNLGSLFFILVYKYVVFLVVMIANLLAKRCSKLNDCLNKRKYKYNYFVSSINNDYFVLCFTAMIGIKNMEFGFLSPSTAINMSNTFTLFHMSICGLMFIFMVYQFIKLRYIRKNLNDEKLPEA